MLGLDFKSVKITDLKPVTSLPPVAHRGTHALDSRLLLAAISRNSAATPECG